MWPTIAVIIPTYNRMDILTETVCAIHDKVRYSGKLRFYIGVDNDKEDGPAVRHMIKNRTGIVVNAVDGPRRTKGHGGLGANLNMLLKLSKESIILQMDDDHLLVRTLGLDPHVEKLLTDETAGCVRLMGIGFHRYCGCLDGCYWRIRWDSPELYIASNRPHLKHRRFHDTFGIYPENIKLGETEERFCHQCKDIAKVAEVPDIMIPLDVMTESSWEHIGQSFQMIGE